MKWTVKVFLLCLGPYVGVISEWRKDFFGQELFSNPGRGQKERGSGGTP